MYTVTIFTLTLHGHNMSVVHTHVCMGGSRGMLCLHDSTFRLAQVQTCCCNQMWGEKTGQAGGEQRDASLINSHTTEEQQTLMWTPHFISLSESYLFCPQVDIVLDGVWSKVPD